ncbi:MAG: tetratricopeptide repeat protein [Candidatus Omnitrophica bacterium]|nr:tetratricopeptide repeat protein [Candidatus Omnitrophota bacterium]
MDKIFLCAMLGLILAGCQPKEEAANQRSNASSAITAERKEAARKLTAQAVALLEQKNYPGVVASLDAAIKADPTDQEPYLILGQILLKAGEFQRAAEFLDTAAKNFPDNGTIFYMLSMANQMSGKKLPAVLAARRSFEIFKGANDQDNAEKSAVLLQQIINAPEMAAPNNPDTKNNTAVK